MNGVEKNLKGTNMQSNDFVVKNAQVIGKKIKSIKQAGKEDVYCLAAAKNGTMIANGIITRNCDALRYAVHTHKVNVYDPYKDKQQRDAWCRNKYDPWGK